MGLTNGLFTATLDFGSGVFTGEARWMEMGVRTNGSAGAFEVMTPRNELTPAPYAVFAGSASNLAGPLPASQLSGAVALTQLPAAVVTNGASAVSLIGAFTGNGAGLTNLNGANLLAGSVGSAQLAVGALAAPARVDGTTLNAVANTRYVVTNTSATSILLPTNANLGDVIQITGEGAGGWTAWASSWTLQTSAPTSEPWFSVASSSDGSHLAAVASHGGVYTSTNFGVNWTLQTSAPTSVDWYSVASSSDGSHLAAGALFAGICTCTDFGETWTWRTSVPINGSGCSLASSSDGSHLTAVVYYGGVYTSTDFGVNWTLQISAPTSAQWCSVASSSDGSHLAAAVFDGGVYISTNFGVNWTLQTSAPTSAQWNSVASSSDGSHLAAVECGGGIYTTPSFIASGVAGTSATLQYLGNGQWGEARQVLDAANLTGTIPLANLPNAVVTNNETGVTLNGSFTGTGEGLTNLNASQVSSGTLADARLSANVARLNANQTFTGSNRFTQSVGIGTTNPATALEIAGSNTTVRVTAQGGNGATAALDLATYDPGTNAPNVRLQASDTNWSGAFDLLVKVPGAATNPLVSRLHITP